MPLTFKRDKVFWTIGAQAIVINYYLGGFSPAQPLLRADQGTSLTVAGLHGTAMGIAAIIAGFSVPHLVHKYGRIKTTWIGVNIFSVGVLMFVLGPGIGFTLFATFLTGFGTSTIISNMVTILAQHYKSAAALAIPQTNAIGSAGYVVGTLIIGILAGTTISWRWGLLLPLPIALITYFVSRDKNAEIHVPHEDGPQRGKLPRHYWIAFIGFFCSISSEFAITFWSAALLRERVGSTAAVSTICIVAVGSGMAIGRWYGGIVLKKLTVDHQLAAAITLQLVSFMIFWVSHNLVGSLIALFGVGLGISTQFSLSSVRLITLSNNKPDLAIARSSIAAGLAIGLAPFMLGVLGDNLGISRAYMMVPVLILISLFITLLIPSKIDSLRA